VRRRQRLVVAKQKTSDAVIGEGLLDIQPVKFGLSASRRKALPSSDCCLRKTNQSFAVNSNCNKR